MFISEAMAQTVQTATDTAATSGAGFAAFAQLILIFGILYLLLIRPQKKKLQRHEAALNSITKGSKVVIGGILGTVSKVGDNNELTVKIADNTEITVIRGYISQVLEEDK
ncbi:MAG: preprotein translocase subunit YajC [Alphaproteobacteria bacterium]|jgi:preprotein translocase subunit YajC|nr:preprotein translocase subunit YajC [Alphaproteobacteria bacterium]